MKLCIVCGNPGHPAYKVHSEGEIRGCGADPGVIEAELSKKMLFDRVIATPAAVEGDTPEL